MSNVIKFVKDTDEVSYLTHGEDFGISSLNKQIMILRLNKNDFIVATPDGDQLHSRKKLAEFLWFAATFIDSEERFRKSGEMVACNY